MRVIQNSFLLTNETHSVLTVATFQSMFFHRIDSNTNPINKLCTLVGYMDLIRLLRSQGATGYSLKPVRSVNTRQEHIKDRFKHSVPFPCRAHAVPLPCLAANGLECVFPIWFTQCGRVWFTLAVPCHAMLRPCCSSQGHSTARPSLDGRAVGKTHSKPLAARHGRGKTWARHAMCESALIMWGESHLPWSLNVQHRNITLFVISERELTLC